MTAWTFGIITVYEDIERLNAIIESIRALNVPEYEILLVGGGDSSGLLPGSDIRQIEFDESERDKWITRKKNILNDNASFDTVVIMHDYHVFDPNFYESFESFGYDWDICEVPQYLITGARNPMDWSLWDKPGHGRAWSLDYNDWSQTQYMYISGAFFIVKRHVLILEPFDESLLWNQEEDVEWSMRVRNRFVMKANGNTAVRHNKWHRHAG